MKQKHLLFIAGICLLKLATAQAATLTVGTQIQLGDNPASNSIKISFFDGDVKYQSPSASGVLGDGTLLDHSFYGNIRQTTSSTLTWVERGAGSGGYLSVAQPAEGALGNPGSLIAVHQYWTTTDPGATFSSTPNYTGSSPNESVGIANNVTGTVNISTLTSGTIYFMFGTFSQAGDIFLEMTGAAQTDLTGTMTWDNPGSTNRYFLQSLTFENPDLLYDTISYNYVNSGAASRGRFGFVALDGVVIPEPSSLALVCLGSLALLRRRR
jgi:hypothetical protein